MRAGKGIATVPRAFQTVIKSKIFLKHNKPFILYTFYIKGF
jgi:hypothetical protein